MDIFTLGGAQSHDRGTVSGTETYDIHKWWWREEMPSEKEYEEAFRNLEDHDNKVDLTDTQNQSDHWLILFWGNCYQGP